MSRYARDPIRETSACDFVLILVRERRMREPAAVKMCSLRVKNKIKTNTRGIFYFNDKRLAYDQKQRVICRQRDRKAKKDTEK
jgi:hypothetical protein